MPDILGDVSTTATVPIGGTVTDTIDFPGDQDWFKVQLTAGQTYVFILSGSGSVPLSGIKWLSIRDSIGQLTSAEGGAPTEFKESFIPTQSGTYYIAVRGDAAATGSYTLSVLNPQLPQGTVDDLAFYMTTRFWTEYWHSPVGAFNTPTITFNVTGLTSESQQLALGALSLWHDVSGLTFVQTAGTAQLTFHDEVGVGLFGGFVSNNGIISQANVWVSRDALQSYGSGFDTYTFQAYLHEIGHALGLGHTGPFDSSNGVYGLGNLFAIDSTEYSVMSYFSPAGTGLGSAWYITTPQIADIVAIQNLYGSLVTAHAREGDTVYGFNSNAGYFFDFNNFAAPFNNFASVPAETIFDTGGIDTLDFSGYANNQVINLRAEAFSSVGGLTNNIGIARGVAIENAIGGPGNDTLIGNSGDNVLDGGLGTDSVIFTSPRSAYTLTALGSSILQVSGPEGKDVLKNVEKLVFADQTVQAVSTVSIAPASATSNEGNSGTTVLTFTVSLDQAPLATETVSYSVAGSGANPVTAADFVGGLLPSGVVTFDPGVSVQTLTINIQGDSGIESMETFQVTLSSPSSGLTLGTASAIGTIVNDDHSTVSIAAASASKNEGNSGTTAFTFTVSLDQAPLAPQTVSYIVTGGVANPASGTDFLGGAFPSGTINFASNTTTQTITITVQADITFEPTETFLVTLFNPSSGLQWGKTTALGTITNDDPLVGNAGNETLQGSSGNDVIDGGGGHNTAVYLGLRSEYALTPLGNGSLTVADSQSGRDGSDTVTHVNYLQFADKLIVVANADEANIARLYSAALNRMPDKDGLNGWEDIYANNISGAAKAGGVYKALAQTNNGFGTSIAGGFVLSLEFQNKYGNLDDGGFVSQLYHNVLGRTPAASEVSDWLDLMHNNGFTRDMVLVGFAESPENIAKTAADWLVQI